MIEVKNQFAKHAVFWVFPLPLVAVLALPAILPPSDFGLSKEEVAFFAESLGRDVPAITAAADGIFDRMFIKTHIATSVRDFFVGGNREDGVDLMKTAGKVSRNYNNAVWLMIYRGLWRMCGLWPVVLSVMLALGMPCLVDGLAVRARKSYNFQFHNPVFFWSASHSLILIMGLGVFLPFMPYALSPLLLCSFAVLICGALWVTAANFQTGN